MKSPDKKLVIRNYRKDNMNCIPENLKSLRTVNKVELGRFWPLKVMRRPGESRKPSPHSFSLTNESQELLMGRRDFFFLFPFFFFFCFVLLLLLLFCFVLCFAPAGFQVSILKKYFFGFTENALGDQLKKHSTLYVTWPYDQVTW